MRAPSKSPTFTVTFSDQSEFIPDAGSAYLYGVSVEDRSTMPMELGARTNNVKFMPLTAEEDTPYFVLNRSSSQRSFSLRSNTSLRMFVDDLGTNDCYLDISGIRHHVWAPLLRELLTARIRVRVVYVEPGDYAPFAIQETSWIYDLGGAGIRGVRPLPGFATLFRRSHETYCFVPLLGFEGARFAHMLEQVQPVPERVIPIVGVPGFRPEYPYRTYQGNMQPLNDSKSWRNVRFAVANCPFAAYYEIEAVAEEFPDCTVQIAPIGTKPHALGGILYAICHPDRAELIYDHPVRQQKRTSGEYRVLVYDVNKIANEYV